MDNNVQTQTLNEITDLLKVRRMETIITVENVQVIVTSSISVNRADVGFALKSDYDKWLWSDDNFDAHSVMVGWKNPIAALKAIGSVAIDHAIEWKKKYPDCVVTFSGCDEKRNRVYMKMLKSAGIPVRMENFETEDGEKYQMPSVL